MVDTPRLSRYLLNGEIGAELITKVAADKIIDRWANQLPLPLARWAY